MKLDAADGQELIALARECVHRALVEGAHPAFPERAYIGALAEPRSAFVTLRIGAALRGCCGSLEPRFPLAEEVWHDAWAAAFRDPRFAAVTPHEWPQLHFHVSVLEQPRPVDVANEDELVEMLEPGRDGLVLEWRGARATFLPAVWEQIGDAREFVRRLKLKAGWPAHFWAPDLRPSIYGVEEFDE
jgi:AmmeMemoRadiSam system protein A